MGCAVGELARLDQLDPEIVAKLVLHGDLSQLTQTERVAYYVHRCDLLGIDPGEKPFELLLLDGKLMLYAGKACANALTRINRLSVAIVSTQFDGDLVTVVARAQDPNGRFSDDVAVLDLSDISVTGGQTNKGKWVKGIGRPNAIMKAATKAKRRAVLSLTGLGVLDDTEVDSVRGARRVSMDVTTGAIAEAGVTVIDAEITDLGPRCEGKAKSLGDANEARAAELAEKYGISWMLAFQGAVKRAKIDITKYGDAPRSAHDLTVPDGQILREWFRAQFEEPEDSEEPTVDPKAEFYLAWRRLTELDPEGYTPEGAESDWARFASLDEWPTNPTAADYGTALDSMLALIEALEKDE